MGKFDGILIATDLDHTLANGADVAKENIEAIRYFQKEGGLFTIATGRYISHIEEHFSKDIVPNCSILTVNGNVVCDEKTHEPTVLSELDRELTSEILSYSYEKGEKDILFVNVCDWNESYKYEGKVTNDTCKCVFVMETEEGAIKLRDDLKEKFGHLINVERSWPVGVEIYAKDGGKGKALDYLRRSGKYPINTIICAGDYENDISMLEYADIGFAVKNATDEAKAAADIVCDATCEEGAIAWIINKLDKEGINL